jgi:hypothetical protein
VHRLNPGRTERSTISVPRTSTSAVTATRTSVNSMPIRCANDAERGVQMMVCSWNLATVRSTTGSIGSARGISERGRSAACWRKAGVARVLRDRTPGPH